MLSAGRCEPGKSERQGGKTTTRGRKVFRRTVPASSMRWSAAGSEGNALRGGRRQSISLADEIPAFEDDLVVVLAARRPARQLDLRLLDFRIGNLTEDVRDRVKPALSLVIGPHEIPGCVLAVGRFQHVI